MGTPFFGTPPQQPVAASAWVPYLNLVRGIRMDYPNNWTLQEQSTPFNFVVWLGSPQRGPQDPFQENLTITVQPVFAGTTLESLVQSWQAMTMQARVQVLEGGSASLAGQNAYRVVLNTPPLPPAGQQNRVLLMMLIVGGQAFTVSYTGYGDDFNLFLPVVQQMLATLQVH